MLGKREAAHFGSVDTGVKGYKARHNLAVVYRSQGRFPEAEGQWRTALADQPGFVPAWIGLAELYLDQRRWPELERTTHQLGNGLRSPVEAAVFRARAHLARREFAAARRLLEETITRAPRDLWPRVILTHVLLQEGKDLDAAEAALESVLQLDPENREARRNLGVLRQQRAQGGGPPGEPTLGELYESACRIPSDLNEHCPALAALAKECRHVTVLGSHTGTAATAFLYGRPEKLVCYDLLKFPQLDLLQEVAGNTQFRFCQADPHSVAIDETDLLFVDAWDGPEDLRSLLATHAGRVGKYLVLHETPSPDRQEREQDDTDRPPRGGRPPVAGMRAAVEELVMPFGFSCRELHGGKSMLAIMEKTCAEAQV